MDSPLEVFVAHTELEQRPYTDTLSSQASFVKVLLIVVGVTFSIAFDAGFTPILTFPHQGGRDYTHPVYRC